MNITIIIIIMLLLAITVIACVRKRNEPQAPNDTDLHNRLFREGSNLITPYMPLHGLSPKDAHGPRSQKDIKNGIGKLEQVLVLNPQNWAAFWVIGKGYQALENTQRAYESFKASWSINKQNVDVAREYMIQCLNLGKSAEGVAIAEEALRLEPNEPGLVANYALALLIDGQMDRAENEVKRSLEHDPADQVTRNLQEIINEVKSGKRPHPSKFSDLTGVK